MKFIKENYESFVLIAQIAEEIAMVERLQRGVALVRCDVGGQVRLRVMPDLAAMVAPQNSEYQRMTQEDLLTLAVRMGITVAPTTIREDLIKIVETAKTDIDLANAMAQKARVMVPRNNAITPQSGNGVSQATSRNAQHIGAMSPSQIFPPTGL